MPAKMDYSKGSLRIHSRSGKYEFEMRRSLIFQNTKVEKISTIGIAWQPRISTYSSVVCSYNRYKNYHYISPTDSENYHFRETDQ